MPVHVRAWFVKFVTPPPKAEFFFNEYETLQILTIFTLTHVHCPSVEIGLCFIRLTVSLFVTSHGSLRSPFVTLPLENLDEVQRCSDFLHRDGFHHHIRWILLQADFYQIDHLIIHDPLMYLVISHINMLRLLVIPVILSEKSHSDCRNEPKLNPVWYWMSQPIISTANLPSMSQLQPCTPALSLKKKLYLATLPFN